MNSSILENPNNDPIIARLIENQLTIQRAKKYINNLSVSSFNYKKINFINNTEIKTNKKQKYK